MTHQTGESITPPAADGVHFTGYRVLLASDPPAPYDDGGVTNPGWAVNERGLITALMYGGTTSCSYNAPDLGVALPQAAASSYTGSTGHAHRQAISAAVQRIGRLYPVEARNTILDGPS
jgi:hypothetical protein